MYQKKIALGCFTLIAIMLLLSGYINFALCSSENVKYLKNNIHTQEHRNEEYRASYANWTNPGKNHVIVPVNTPSQDRKLQERICAHHARFTKDNPF